METSPVHAVLKEMTLQAHQAAENRLDLLDPQLSIDRYKKICRHFAVFHNAFEDFIGHSEWTKETSLGKEYLSHRKKAGWLHEDLRFLENTSSVQEAGPEIKAHMKNKISQFCRTEAHLWGIVYVIEGSTLGGQIIKKYLEKNLGLSGGQGYRYFLSYGDQVGLKWKSFLSLLGMKQFSETEMQEAVASANQAFELMVE